MKPFFSLIMAAVIGATAAGVVAWAVMDTTHRKVLREKEAQLTNLKEENQKYGALRKPVPSRKTSSSSKEAKPAPEAGKPESPEDSASPDEDNEYTPEKLLQYLEETDPIGPDENRKKRRIIYCFVGLADFGTESLAVIGEFLKGKPVKGSDDRERIDLQYESTDRKDDNRAGEFLSGGKDENPENWRSVVDYWGGMAYRRTGELFPQSLRIGLFEIVSEIGGPEAEDILALELAETGRGVEVVILGELLEQLSPGKYKEAMLQAARELIEKPLDDDSRRILFALLHKHKDQRLVEFAKKILVNSEGRIEGAALRYINETLGESAMPILYQLYKNPDITNPGDKLIISDAAMTYVGKNADADNIFREVFDDGLKNAEKTEANPREAYGKLFIAGGSLLKGNPSPQVIRNRQKLLGEYLNNTKNPLIKRGLEDVNRQLGDKLTRLESNK